MFCKKCGSQLEDGSRFCGKCGTAQEAASEMAASMSDAAVQSNAAIAPVAEEKAASVFVSAAPSDAVVLGSSAPIPSKTGWATYAYGASAVLIFAGGVGLLGLFVTYIAEKFMMTVHNGQIRGMKFKFVSNASPDDIYSRLQPALMSKLGENVQFEREGDTISVEYDSMIYDILVKEDSTFSVWWRKSVAGSLFSWNEWKLYKKVRTGTAIVAYELQQQFGIC